MITSRPIRVRDFAELLSEIKYQAIDIPMQKQLSSQGLYHPGGAASNNQSQGGEPSLPERIDDSIGT